MLAARRYPTIRNLTLPMKSFLVTSSGTFVGIIAADHASRDFDVQRNQERLWYEKRESQLHNAEMAGMGLKDRALAYAKQEKYKIVGATWVASMIGSFMLVGRNPYLTGPQKIVQARVYAQGLTVAVLVASAAFEISDQRKGKGILDSARREKQAVKQTAEEEGKGDVWKDLVAAEEHRLKKKHQNLYEKPHQHGQQEEQAVKAEGEEKEKEKEEKQEKEGAK